MRMGLMILLLIGCHTNQKLSSFPTKEAPLFPYGIYTQKVLVQIKQDQGKQTYPLDGVMKYDSQSYHFVGMTFFGSRIFESIGPSDGSEPPQIKLYIDLPDYIQKKMDEISTQMLIMLGLKRNQFIEEKGKLVFRKKGFRISISKISDTGTPLNFRVDTQGWSFHVRTVEHQAL